MSACCPERTLARHPCPFALRYRRAPDHPEVSKDLRYRRAPDHPEVSKDLRYRRARAGRPVAQLPSLCSLCLCALCVQRRPFGQALLGIDVCCWEAASDTEDTETQGTQRNFGYISSGLSRPFLRYLRTCRTSGPSIP